MGTLIATPVNWSPETIANDEHMTLAESESMRHVGDATTIFAEHVMNGRSIDPEGRKIIDGVLLQILDDENEMVKVDAVLACFESGLIERPEYDAKIRPMLRHPSDHVRGIVEKRYAGYAEFKKYVEARRGKR